VRIVPDTNVIVSGLFWQGPPSQIMRIARRGVVQVFTTRALLLELEDVLARPRFRASLDQLSLTPASTVSSLAALVQIVEPAFVPRGVVRDLKDDKVIACAVSAKANVVVSGDRHLLTMGAYGTTKIMGPSEFLRHLTAQPRAKPEGQAP
jgi:putative PIN family toxin of toxin-antitoxin system